MALAAIDPVRPSGPSDSASDSHTETAQQSKATIIIGIKQQIWHSQQLVLSDQVGLQIIFLERRGRSGAESETRSEQAISIFRTVEFGV